ncbi:hypothetical protein BT93_J0492 [Corymbia citriodora subsp. variegata]|nr:hypothetical protein BT93_J0492 [Corymbia citriodora subsp. variegata]
MGNCLFGGFGEAAKQEIVKVVAPNGGVMEFYAPIAVWSIADEFPGHKVFRAHDLFWNPLPPHEELVVGESYYLLPYDDDNNKTGEHRLLLGNEVVRAGHVRSNSIPTSLVAPYRMSLDYQGMLKRSYTEVFARESGKSNDGVWKVKLVISPKQLVEILSQEGQTQELVESIRAVVKCGNSPASGGFSDQWSLPSSASRTGSSNTEGLVDI